MARAWLPGYAAQVPHLAPRAPRAPPGSAHASAGSLTQIDTFDHAPLSLSFASRRRWRSRCVRGGPSNGPRGNASKHFFPPNERAATRQPAVPRFFLSPYFPVSVRLSFFIILFSPCPAEPRAAEFTLRHLCSRPGAAKLCPASVALFSRQILLAICGARESGRDFCPRSASRRLRGEDAARHAADPRSPPKPAALQWLVRRDFRASGIGAEPGSPAGREKGN